MQFSSSILACGTDMRHIVNEALRPRMFVQNFVVISPKKPLGKKLAPGWFKSHRLVSSSSERTSVTRHLNDFDAHELSACSSEVTVASQFYRASGRTQGDEPDQYDSGFHPRVRASQHLIPLP